MGMININNKTMTENKKVSKFDVRQKYNITPKTSSGGFTKLMYLIINEKNYENGHQKIIKHLAKLKTKDINKKNFLSWTALIIAAFNSNTWSSTKTVKLLLDNGAILHTTTKYGFTALTFAADHSGNTSNIDTVKLLLEYGADINHSSNGFTPLFFAACNVDTTSTPETVKFLLEQGADPNIITKKGNNPLTIFLEKHGEKYNDVKKLLIDYTNIDQHYDNGQTLLMKLAGEQSTKLLIDLGANINLKDDNGETVLNHALQYQSINIVKMLIDKGADVHNQTNNGKTILMYACMYCDVDIIKIILEKAVNVNLQDIYGYTALIYASNRGKIEIVELLINYGGDCLIISKDKDSVFSCNKKTLKILKLYNQVEFTKTCMKKVLPNIRDQAIKFTSHPDSLSIKLLNLKWLINNECIDQALNENNYLLDYFGINNEDTLRTKVCEYTKFMDQ
ncbi:putative ankyrin repeat protein [Cotonvirus japonicus]|uniref:Ankyrin repeat protein n=1 Tax=Cotonvirus japonicus TaxID=2811091 RepID=A0ABM7NTX7_9VIRU|nr:putative ankyrin repeat protein [Cotonvirus japonicus]BCS83579.1 putative ankyrin repeat protein [Cotonvirus japonicus]